MLSGEAIDISTKTRHPIKFFDDDTIETVRSKMIDIHPDRLFILVGLKLPGDYYMKDPRRWEMLFERLSYNGEPIQKEIFDEFQTNYRIPETRIPFYPYDRVEWMSKPDELKPLFQSTEFVEYRIFGVDESKSYILPLNFNSLVSRINAVKLPIPELSKLVNSLYKPEQIHRFIFLPYTEEADSYASAYYPLLRSKTPTQLTEESLRLVKKNESMLSDILRLDSIPPKEVSILRTRFYIPWVETNFGSIRTKFEQIFYGLTVSKKTPYIGMFTSKDQVSRHKFYTEDIGKQPYVDMSSWNAWWSVKPHRNIPTLLLYRGKTKHYFDRIAITSSDMIVSTYRPEGNKETLEDLREGVAEWIQTLDAIIPFISEDDLDKERWELQDMSYVATFSDSIEDFNLLRLNCLNFIFDMPDKSKSTFNLLRTDHSASGLSAIEVKIIRMIKDNQRVSSEEVASELSISVSAARQLMDYTIAKVTEDPRLAEKTFRGYPTIQLGSNSIIVSSVSNLSKSLEYASILRYILSDPKSAKLDAVCPKRSEKVVSEAAIISADLQVDAAASEEYGDLFGELEGEEETESISESVVSQQVVSLNQRLGTTYGYFQERLQKFDPDTFDLSGSKYSKKCEQQPIILDDKDLARISGSPYDVDKLSDEQFVDLENPNGKLICPEYWCMKDQIPLKESQLEKEDGTLKCPVCHGKLQTRSSDRPREYPLIKRDNGHIYPGYKNDKFPKSQKHMPCCFKKPQSKKNLEIDADKYYILGVDKIAKSERIAFLPVKIINSLFIPEKYELFKDGKTKRLMAPNKGYFRVGLGSPSETLPKFLRLKMKIPPPHEAIEVVLKCSFLHSWNKVGTSNLDYIKTKVHDKLVPIISGISEAFMSKELTPLQELEYSALALQCDIFRITDGSLACTFYSPVVRPRSRGVIILQNEDKIDILSYTERETRGFKFFSNIFEEPFPRETFLEVEKLRNAACRTSVPSYNDALNFIQQLIPILEVDDYSIILDPFGRAQAFYIPQKLILPFQPSPLPAVSQSIIAGYKDIITENLPTYDSIKKLLTIPGYMFKEDLYNNSKQISEILLDSGLRIPVQPKESDNTESSEVIETLREVGEHELVFGNNSSELKEQQIKISYAAEIYEFLLFQLSNDLTTDYRDLAIELFKVSPVISNVAPLLEKWFNDTISFLEINNPKQFISKIRKPCDDKCDGDLCGWDGDVCKVKISSTINKDKLFHRLLVSLTENSKIRAIVLDGRSTPFFSTILYLELPHELIVTDNELPD